MNKKDNGMYNVADDVLARLRRIAKSNNLEECEKAVTDLRLWELFQTSKLAAYFENTWYPELRRWCRAYRPDDLFRCNTNNGTERLNESLKYDTLDRYKNSSLTELIKSLAQSFLPDLYEKYVSLNIQYTSGHKGYCPTIPRYMVNRPGPLVENMLRKMNNVTPFMVSSVYPVTPSISPVFEVESINDVSNTKRMYTVRFGDGTQICSCECTSFRIDRLLCKHFFAVFKSVHPFGFVDISPLYLNHPYTTIDIDVVGGASIDVVGANAAGNIADVEEPIEHEAEVETDLDGDVAQHSLSLSTSLPLRRKNRVSNSHPCFARMKVISDKLYNNPQFRDVIDSKLVEILDQLKELESATYGDGELGTHENTAVIAAVAEPVHVPDVVPARRYPNDLCIYNDLPVNKGKRKHAYSGRYGEVAERMRKQLRTNVPVKPPNPQLACCIITDGTTDDMYDPLVFEDRDLDQEERDMIADVEECIADMLDSVEVCEYADMLDMENQIADGDSHENNVAAIDHIADCDEEFQF